MNADHEIYEINQKMLDEEPEKVAEDKARLDGYLSARAEADELARMKRKYEAALKAAFREMEDSAR